MIPIMWDDDYNFEGPLIFQEYILLCISSIYEIPNHEIFFLQPLFISSFFHMFFSASLPQAPSFRKRSIYPVENKMYNTLLYSIFRSLHVYEAGKLKILNCIVANIPGIKCVHKIFVIIIVMCYCSLNVSIVLKEPCFHYVCCWRKEI